MDPVACEADALPACEARLADAIARGRDAGPLARAYVAARRDAAEADPLASLVAAAGESARDRVLVIALPGATPATVTQARTLTAPRVPATGPALGDGGWLLALAHATGASHVLALEAGGSRTHAVRRDPLRIFVAGLPPVFRTRGGRPVDDDITVVAAVDRAFAAAATFDHATAAAHADALAAAWRGRPDDDGAGRRARLAAQLLATAGIALESDDAATTFPPASASPPVETAYEAMLAVRTATDATVAYPPRRARLAAALGPVLAPLLDAWVGGDVASALCPQATLPTFDDDRQVAFGGLLATSLLPAGVATADARGRLPLETWYPRYEAFHRSATRLGLGWWAAGILLTERGGSSGIGASATPTHRAVTELGRRHVRGLAQLVEKSEGRAGFGTVAAVAMLPGVREDPELAPHVTQLAQRATQVAMARAADPAAVALAVLSGVSSAFSYPPEVQAAQLNALQAAFTAQLRGNLAQQKGWGVAGLLALDAAYRVVADQAPDLPRSADAIAHALADPAVEQPGLAALAIAASRYAVLGTQGAVGAPILEKGKDGPKPARAEARRALREALSRLGDGSPPPAGTALDDLTDLVDGTVATTVLALGASKPGDGGPTCASSESSPTVSRALGKLRDVRRRVVAASWFRAGDDRWTRRARLLVLVTSDVLDLDQVDGEGATFAIDDTRAGAIVREGIADVAPAGLADALAGAHVLARGHVAAKPDPAGRARAVRELLVGLRSALTDESTGGLAGAGILDVLASERIVASLSADPAAALERDLAPALTREAERLATAGDRSRSDLLLLVVAGIGAAAQQGVPEDALALADRRRSPARWVLHERDAAARLRAGKDLDEPRLRAALADAVPPVCGRATTDLVADVATATSDFRAGRRDEARATMRAVVERLERAPAVLPRTTFHYREHVGTRIFQITLGMTPSAGLLTSSNTFQVGLGFQTVPMPHTSFLRVALDPSESPVTSDSSSRFAVHAAGLAAVFELLGGDPRRAERAAALAYARAQQAARSAIPGEPSIARDGAAALLLAGQLLGEQGRALLAGDLLALVRSTLDEGDDDAAVAEVLAALPLGLEGAKDAEEAQARAARTLAVLGEKLRCTTAKVDLARYETPRCEAYPMAIALRVADAVPRLPRLAVIDAKTCPHASLDRFFGRMDEGGYDPDALGRAVDDRIALGHAYDASVLLTRLRPAEHCTPGITGAGRALGETEGLPPAVRAESLLVAANCGHDRAADDVVTADRLLVAAGDVERTFQILAVTAFSAAGARTPAPLERLVGEPGYHDRWLPRGARLAVTALTLDHAGLTLAGGTVRPGPTEALHRTLCRTFPAQEREAFCTAITALRRTDTPLADRQAVAEKALESVAAMLTGTQGPAPAP